MDLQPYSRIIADLTIIKNHIEEHLIAGRGFDEHVRAKAAFDEIEKILTSLESVADYEFRMPTEDRVYYDRLTAMLRDNNWVVPPAMMDQFEDFAYFEWVDQSFIMMKETLDEHLTRLRGVLDNGKRTIMDKINRHLGESRSFIGRYL